MFFFARKPSTPLALKAEDNRDSSHPSPVAPTMRPSNVVANTDSCSANTRVLRGIHRSSARGTKQGTHRPPSRPAEVVAESCALKEPKSSHTVLPLSAYSSKSGWFQVFAACLLFHCGKGEPISIQHGAHTTLPSSRGASLCGTKWGEPPCIAQRLPQPSACALPHPRTNSILLAWRQNHVLHVIGYLPIVPAKPRKSHHRRSLTGSLASIR
eukprot:2763423-Amphidinium_carterae.2